MPKLLEQVDTSVEGAEAFRRMRQEQPLLAGAHGRFEDGGDAEVVIRGPDRQEIAQIPFVPPEDPQCRASAFDRSGETFWTARGDAPNCWLYAFDVATRRVTSTRLDFGGEVWLLPDWAADRVVLVGTVDDVGVGWAERSEMTSAGTIAQAKAVQLSWANDWQYCASPVHYFGGRIVAAGEQKFGVFPPSSEVGEDGPPLPAYQAMYPVTSTPDRFVIASRSSVWVYDAASVQMVAELPAPQYGRYWRPPNVYMFANDRLILGRQSPRRQTGHPFAQLFELWQL